MAFKMSPIGKKKCSYSPMQKRGLISPALNNGEPIASSGGDVEKDPPKNNNAVSANPTDGAATVEVGRKVEGQSYDSEFRNSHLYNSKQFSTESGIGLKAHIPKDWKTGKKTGRQPIYQYFSKNHPHGIDVTKDQFLSIKRRGEGPTGNTQPYNVGGIIAPGGKY